MCKAPVLIHVNPDKPFVLETDCSDCALASILSQAVYDVATAQHVLKPVGYHSRTLNEPERNYEIYDKELLAIVECLKHWRVYLHSNNQLIRILSNHQNLEYFMTTKQLTRREACWALLISEYNFVIQYRTGISNKKADALSWKPGDKPLKGSDQTTGSVLKPHHFAQITVMVIVNDQDLRNKIIEAQEKNKLVWSVESFLSKRSLLPLKMRKGFEDYTMAGEILMRNSQVYIPNDNSIKKLVLESRHDTKTAGHLGRVKTLELVMGDFWWPTIRSYVNSYVDRCDLCQWTKTRTTVARGPLMPLEIPQGPWQSI
jgi:hypothetical protein